MEKETVIAGTIVERLELNELGYGGSVMEDLEEILETGDYFAFEDYFGDDDPIAYL